MEVNLVNIGTFSIKNLKVRKTIYIDIPDYYFIQELYDTIPLIKLYTKGKLIQEVDIESVIDDNSDIIDLIKQYNIKVEEYNKYLPVFKKSQYIAEVYTEIYFSLLQKKLTNGIIPSNKSLQEEPIKCDFFIGYEIRQNNNIVNREKECNEILLQEDLFSTMDTKKVEVFHNNSEKIFDYNKKMIDRLKTQVLNELFKINKTLNEYKIGDEVEFKTKDMNECKKGIIAEMETCVRVHVYGDLYFFSGRKDTIDLQFTDIIRKVK